jgi:hypothetical protein
MAPMISAPDEQASGRSQQSTTGDSIRVAGLSMELVGSMTEEHGELRAG